MVLLCSRVAACIVVLIGGVHGLYAHPREASGDIIFVGPRAHTTRIQDLVGVGYKQYGELAEGASTVRTRQLIMQKLSIL